MKLYAGIDLHANNNYLAIIDESDTRVYKRKLPNEPDVILAELEPFKKDISGIVFESTFNWYWLVDLLMESDYCLHLANPAAIQKYKGLKHSDDNHDAFWLAHMLRLNILPEGYIYPKEDRPIRDLLRKRGHLVQVRTALINTLQGIISRNCGCSLNSNKIKAFKEDHVTPLLSGQEDLELSGTVSKDCIDFLTRKIRDIEQVIKGKTKLRQSFIGLQTIPGVGHKETKRKGSSLPLASNRFCVISFDYVQTITYRIPKRLASCHESWQEKGKYFPGLQRLFNEIFSVNIWQTSGRKVVPLFV